MKVLTFLRALPIRTVDVIRRTPPLVFATTVLSIGGLIGFTSASKILVDGFPVSNTITVTGSSTERIESDIAKWEINVSTRGGSQVDSYKKHKVSIEKTLAFLSRYGVSNNDYQSVALLPASTVKEKYHNRRTGEIISTEWVTKQLIEIESNDVFNIDQTYRRTSELLGQGVLVRPRRPEFTYTKLAAKRVEMLAKATKDAHTRAKAIVYQTGSGLGSVKKVDTGVFQITVPNSTKVSSWGSYDTSTINKDITAVMGVTFEVN